MSSAIFYRFRSQKEPSRILFDGTGITVFDLKKEIINTNKLGAGLDFDLRIYNPDTNEEYDDDTQVIPRSTSIVARRSPATRNNKGTASRYVTGKPRIIKSNIQALKQSSNNPGNNASLTVPLSNGTGTEEDQIKMMFKNQDDQWKETQVNMASATPVYNTKQSNNTEDLPPPGYMCYRCGGKDHWIKNCPTNDDPNWEGKRIKRTTGIPKSYLKTIEKPADDDENQNYMITEEGKYVVAVADSKAWETYQKRNVQNQANFEIDDESLVDPITKKLLVKPMKTPCCGKTYSQESIENVLLDSDFVCPNCGEEDTLLDTLVPDTEIQEKITKFIKENEQKLGIKRSQEEEEEEETNKRVKLDLNNNISNPLNLPIRPDIVNNGPVPNNFIPPFVPGMPFPPVPMMMAPVMPIQSNNNSNNMNHGKK